MSAALMSMDLDNPEIHSWLIALESCRVWSHIEIILVGVWGVENYPDDQYPVSA